MVKEASVSFGQGTAPKRGVTAGEVELMIAEYQANVEADVSVVAVQSAKSLKKVDNSHFDIVAEFNADNTGQTDSSTALRNIIIESIKRNPASPTQKTTIYLPPGTFNIDLNKVFSDFNFTSLGLNTTVKKGLRFVGAGRFSTILKLITNGTEKWFYDNESISNQKFSHIFFEHMSFETDDITKGNGFKQWSQGGEKQFWFFDCYFKLATIMQFEGTGNADLNRFLLCGIEANEDAFIYNNNQSVANELISCNLLLRKGYVRVKTNGGGSHKHIGGNLEMHPHATDLSDHYLIHIEQNANLAQGNCDYNLSDVRFEIHGQNKKLVKTYLDAKQVNVNFTKCQFGTAPDGTREVVHVYPTKRVVFENCLLNDNFTYKVEGTFSTSSGTPSGAQLMFYNCDVGRTLNLHEKITKIGDVYRVIADGCFRQSSSASSSIAIQDFDFGWDNIAPAGVSAKKKITPIKQAWNTFPTAVGGEKTLLLPSGCFITRIYIKKPAIASTSDNFNLKIGNDAKTIVLGESGSKAHNQEHLIDIKDLGALSYNKLRIWGEGVATTAQSGGVAYVEYI